MYNILLILITVSFVISCSGKNVEYNYPKSLDEVKYERDGSIINGDDSMGFSVSSEKKQENEVNSYLWRAALDVISFVPLEVTDHKGGVIITEWYAEPSVPNEQFKFNIIIMGTDLSVTSLKLTAFRQVKNKNGAWVSKDVDKSFITKMEDSIFARAKKLKIESRR